MLIKMGGKKFKKGQSQNFLKKYFKIEFLKGALILEVCLFPLQLGSFPKEVKTKILH